MAQVGAGVASPMRLLGEYTSAVRALLHGETVTVAGRYVRLDGVALNWPPAQVPPLLVGARGPKTLRLAGELADGVILDSGITPDGVRAALGHVERGRVAGGWSEPALAVAYLEVADPTVDGLREQVLELAAAGAGTVVLQPPGPTPDPEPLIATIARWSAASVDVPPVADGKNQHE
jgi:alkanesulfonate monooxygenase SsuD/methylene tetrahydromethanopterin reductase-like flavin-dependent oxidoreductase (luciferase family)